MNELPKNIADIFRKIHENRNGFNIEDSINCPHKKGFGFSKKGIKCNACLKDFRIFEAPKDMYIGDMVLSNIT